MRYVSVEDLVRFAFDNKWMYCEHVEDLRPFIEEGIAQGKVRSMDTDCSDGIDRLEDLEERVKKLEEAVWPKNIDYGSHSDSMVPAVKEIGFESRGETIHILERMRDKIQKFGYITIASYYYISGKPEYISYKLFDYGWTNLNNAGVYSYLKEGGARVYCLKLPDPLPIKLD